MNESRSIAPAEAPARYPVESIVLHWVLAIVIAALFLFGVTMADLPLSPQRLKYYNWHKWAGICVLAASLLRLAIRAARGVPRLTTMPMWQERTARAAHTLLYLLTLAVPLVGWAYSSAAGFPVVLFGTLALPDLVPVDRDWAGLLKAMHGWMAWALVGIAGLHGAAAIKHHFIDRDQVLRRMWPGTLPKEANE